MSEISDNRARMLPVFYQDLLQNHAIPEIIRLTSLNTDSSGYPSHGPKMLAILELFKFVVAGLGKWKIDSPIRRH